MFRETGQMIDIELIKDLRTIGKNNKISAIILFGSTVREERTEESDVDLCIILDKLDPALEKKIFNQILDLENKYDYDFQVIYSNKHFEGLDRQFVENILREGEVLFGNIPNISIQKLELQAFSLIKFSIRNLSSAEKNKLNRYLYGKTSTKKYKNKFYSTRKPGVVERVHGFRMGRGSIMVPINHSWKLEKMLDEHGVSVQRINVWLSKI